MRYKWLFPKDKNIHQCLGIGPYGSIFVLCSEVMYKSSVMDSCSVQKVPGSGRVFPGHFTFLFP